MVKSILCHTVALASEGHSLTPSGLDFLLGSVFFCFIEIFLRAFEHGY
eukprot:COSAG02_NODE_19083_length_901_cov_0.857855_1_plen_47_part_10